MDSKTFREVALSYAAVYNQDLREWIQEKQNFESWVDSLLDEGYDLSDYTWEEVYEAYVAEVRAPGVKPYQPMPRRPLPPSKPLSGETGDRSGYGPEEKFKDWKLGVTPSTVDKKGKTVSQRMDAEKPYGKRMTGELAREYGSRPAAEVTRVVRGPGEPRAVKLPQEPKKPKMVKKDGKWVKEGYDLYDIILSHLINEGYAETQEAAEAIMVNMSEEWRESIVEKEDSPYEKASDAALDAKYGYGRATGNKHSFGRAANRSSAAAALRAIRRGERSGSGTSTEAGADAVHQGWARTARTSADQTPEKKARRAELADTPYSKLPDDEKEKDRVSFNAVSAVYNNRNR